MTQEVTAVATDGRQVTACRTFLTPPWFTLLLAVSCPPAGKRLGFTIDSGKFHNVSLGQGQEMVAETALEKASREGHWVILQVSITFSGAARGMSTKGSAEPPCPVGMSLSHNTG